MKNSRKDAAELVHWLRRHASSLWTEEFVCRLTDVLDAAWCQGYDDALLEIKPKWLDSLTKE